MDIKVLGTGCANCTKLYTTVEKALAQSGVTATLSKVEDIDAIMRHGVMTTPALVIDGKVMVAGRVPDVAQVSSWLTTAAAEADPRA